jgi:hypothetical protein
MNKMVERECKKGTSMLARLKIEIWSELCTAVILWQGYLKQKNPAK